MSKEEITGNRDSSYSNWQRRAYCRGYGVWDDDMYDPLFVYRVTNEYDEEGLPKVAFKFETKGIVIVDDKIILPNCDKHYRQFDAIRSDCKRYDKFGSRCDVPGYCVWYVLEKDIKYFLVVALNDPCLKVLGNRIVGMTEAQYIRFFLSLIGTSLWSYNYDTSGIKKTSDLFDEDNKRNFIFSIKKYFKEL
jgi:hypothetical protein